MNEITEFHNLHHIFLCQLPPRFDFHNINAKVTCFNQLLIEHFADTEEFVTVVDAVPAEFKYHHHDGLHLSDVGVYISQLIRNQSSDILQHSQNRPTGDRWLKF